MDEILRDIQDVAGVTGCFVADSTGQVVTSTLPGVFDSASLTQVAKTLAKTIEGLRMARRKKVSELDLVFESGRLVAKVLSPGYLFILCVPSINVPLLNLTANVAAKKLASQLSAQAAKPAPAAAAPAAPVAPKEDLVARLESIISVAMGVEGLELFREELAGIGQGANPPRAALAELTQALYFPSALAIGGGSARKMVDG
ncbi:MAG: roadblock/LC7 domain-containing protein, partial [Anaerolineales bacterium]|nr:roadblock/LC7 domain-containing protein [Anaerolineales bacterium]